MKNLFTAASAFILGVGAGWLIQGRHWDVFLTSYIPALATLLAAFYGAKYAFQFQKDKELEDIKKRNLVSANASIFALSRMANNLFIYQRDVINTVRNSPGRFLELRPTLDLEKEYVQLNFDTLAFLLETEHMNLLGEVIAETEKYRSAIDAINGRSRLHLQTIQPQLEQASFPAQNQISIQQIEECLGDRLTTTLRESTDQVIEHVDSAIISLKDVADRLRRSIKLLYPNDKVIGFSLPE
ncbi:MAG: hypothetical protein ACAH18_12625 [Methylophilaceae bacterium]